MKKKLVRQLKELTASYGAVGLKLSTEDEGLTHQAVTAAWKLFHRRIPVILKIGGPEARGDFTFAYNLGIRSFVVPMVESLFALKKFFSILEPLDVDHRELEISINIETGLAVKNLPSIMSSNEFRKLSRVNIGRGDLSRSLAEKNVDTAVVDRDVRKIICNLKKPFSVGGGVIPAKISSVIDKFQPPFFNTRNVLFKSSNVSDPVVSVNEALRWEIDFLRYQKIAGRKFSSSLDRRIGQLKTRMQL